MQARHMAPFHICLDKLKLLPLVQDGDEDDEAELGKDGGQEEESLEEEIEEVVIEEEIEEEEQQEPDIVIDDVDEQGGLGDPSDGHLLEQNVERKFDAS